MLVKLAKFLSPIYWRVLDNYYKESSVYVYSEKDGYSENFKTSVGVKQGGKFSPTAFNVNIDSLIQILIESGIVFKINEVVTGILVYADDTTLILETVADAQIALSLVEKFCQLEDITINVKKTQWMKLGEPIRYEKDSNG